MWGDSTERAVWLGHPRPGWSADVEDKSNFIVQARRL
jgi:hypothetical protein